jgi:hypothetical protein
VVLPPLESISPPPALEETRYEVALDAADDLADGADVAADGADNDADGVGDDDEPESEGSLAGHRPPRVPDGSDTATADGSVLALGDTSVTAAADVSVTAPAVPAPPAPPTITRVPAAALPANEPEGYADLAGDHDGLTQLAEDLPIGYTPPPVVDQAPAGTVLAVLCPSGHASAPHSSNCRLCGQPISATEAVPVQRPVLARIRISTGELIDVDRPIVLGRAPFASRVAASDLPRLVTVPSPNQDISRAHAQIRATDWQLVVADLDSTNGTTVRPPGRAPQRLHPRQEVVVEPGWSVDLGDGISFVVEAVP